MRQVHFILSELVMGGMVLETNMTEILTRIEEQTRIEKQEVCAEWYGRRSLPLCPVALVLAVITVVFRLSSVARGAGPLHTRGAVLWRAGSRDQHGRDSSALRRTEQT